MAADNYKEILEEVCNKIKNINSVNEIDISDIKNSVESIENLVTDTQAKLNFQEIKEKLETISYNINSCNEAYVKNLYNDINNLKTDLGNVEKFLENIRNNQNLSLTTAEFEEFQKQQLDFNLKNQENLFKELEQIKDKTQSPSGSENLGKLESDLNNLHGALSSYLEQIISNVQKFPNLEEIMSVMNNINKVHQHNISETNELVKELQTSVSNFSSDLRNSDFAKQISKISAIYESLNIVQAWVEKAGYINKSIESLYSKLGDNLNFNDWSQKIDSIYNNIQDLSNLTLRIDEFNASVDEIESNLSKNALTNITGNIDFEDAFNKVDIVYENVSELNNIASKIDKVDSSVSDLSEITDKIDIVYENISELNTLVEKIDKVDSSVSDFSEITDKIDVIYENISELNIIASKIDKIDSSVVNFNSAITELTSKISEFTNSQDSLKENLKSLLPEDFDIIDITNKIDIIYDNLQLLNEWAGKIDNIDKNTSLISTIESKIDNINKNTSLINTMESKIDDISKNTENINDSLSKSVIVLEGLPDIEEKLDELSKNIHISLNDIEEDFSKLNQYIDNSNQVTSDDINSIKEKFSELNDDLSSISVRTNKLILSADDANKEFKNYLEIFKNTIDEFSNKQLSYNPEIKFAVLGQKLNKMTTLIHNNIIANNNINKAFVYLAEWIDASGKVLNDIQNGIESLNASAFKENNEEISEIKSLISSIIVQINTSLSPNIDLINEKIEKLTEEDSHNFEESANIINTKIDAHSKQINALESKIEKLSEKFDKLIEILTEDTKDYDTKDMLNYIVSQVSNLTESIKSNQNSDDAVKRLEDKISEFSSDVKKIVAYIEED